MSRTSLATGVVQWSCVLQIFCFALHASCVLYYKTACQRGPLRAPVGYPRPKRRMIQNRAGMRRRNVWPPPSPIWGNLQIPPDSGNGRLMEAIPCVYWMRVCLPPFKPLARGGSSMRLYELIPIPILS